MEQNNDIIMGDIGFILFQDFDLNKNYNETPLLKDYFLRLIRQSGEPDEYEMSKLYPYSSREMIIGQKELAEWEIENYRLRQHNILLSYSIYNVAVYPLNKYFYMFPLLYLKDSDFAKLSENAILSKIYYDEKYASTFQTIDLKVSFEGFILSDNDIIQFINEIKAVNTDLFLKDAIERFEKIKEKRIIIQKAL